MLRDFNGLDDVVIRAAHGLNARPYDVGDYGPSTVPDLFQCDSAQLGRITIWPGGTDTAIYADRRVNWLFRAWHDTCHLRTEAGFDVASEYWLADYQRAEASRYGDLFAEIVHCEIGGQARYFERYGKFCNDQRAFTLAYLNGESW